MTFRAFALRTLYLALLIVFLFAAWHYRSAFLLVFCAILIAIGLSIPVTYLEKLKVPRFLAILLSIGLFIALTILFNILVFPGVSQSMHDVIEKIPTFQKQLAESYTQLSARENLIGRVLPPIPEGFATGKLDPKNVRDFGDNIMRNGLPFLASGGNFLLGIVANLLLITMLAVFFLIEPSAYVKSVLYLVPIERQHDVKVMISVLYYTLRTWISTLMISVSMTVALVWIILGVLGMPNVPVVAAFAGLATFIPNIGAFLPIFPIVLFLLVDSPEKIPLMIAVYLGIQLLESNLLTPSIVRRQLSIPLAAILIAQIFSGLLFGALGVLLAVPMLATLITLVREIYSYRMLNLRDYPVDEKLPPPNPYAKNTNLRHRAHLMREHYVRRRGKVIVTQGEEGN